MNSATLLKIPKAEFPLATPSIAFRRFKGRINWTAGIRFDCPGSGSIAIIAVMRSLLPTIGSQ
jgi:hypothetical protein